MTPDERYALQAALGDLESSAQRIRDILNLGTNPNINATQYRANLIKQMHRCRCEFGWQPDCPQHMQRHDPPNEDPCSAPEHTPGNACPPPEDHQDERPDGCQLRHPTPKEIFGA